MTAAPPGRQILSRPRSRRDAAKVLAVALQTRYRKLLDASGEDEIIIATTDLAQCMYENVEFVIWALKAQGGMNPPPPEQLRKITPLKQPANDDPRFTKPPKLVLEEDTKPGIDLATLPCSCETLEHGIIGRGKHATNCPKYVP